MTSKDILTGKCALYGVDCDLQISHILPKFTHKYLIKTGSKYMRRLVEPTRRMQDGIKIPLLSREAELEFSKRETYFKNQIFDNVVETDEGSFKYDERLYYFILSILWRVVQFNKDKELKRLSFNENRSVLNAEKVWTEYLKGGALPAKYNKLYLNISGKRIKNHSINSINIDYYLTRMSDFTLIRSDRGNYLSVYAKFGRFTFWTVLNGRGTNKLKLQRIDPKGGEFVFPCNLKEPNIGNFLYNRIKGIENIGYNLSPKQEHIILSEFKTSVDPYSDLVESMLTDIKLESRKSQNNL